MSKIKHYLGEWSISDYAHSPTINIDYWQEADKQEFYEYINTKLSETYETVSLQLSGDKKGDLYGIKIIYNNITSNFSQEKIWKNVPINFEVKTGDVYYFTINGTDLGYDIINTNEVTALANNNRVIEVTINQAELTINVEGITSDFVINVLSQNGKLLEQSFVNSKTIVLPKNIICDIVPLSVKNYMTPSAQTVTVTDSQTVNIKYRYNKGIFAIDSQGEYWTLQELKNSGNTSNIKYIAVITDSHKFGIFINNDIVLPIGVDGNTTFSSLSKLTIVPALSDLSGIYNTNILTSIWSDSSAYAAPYCKSLGGYLGALGEWAIIFKNTDEINEMLSFVGGTPLNDSYITSTPGTQPGTSEETIGMWSIGMLGSSAIGVSGVATTDNVRPLYKLI